jgi:hypothetical protein
VEVPFAYGHVEISRRGGRVNRETFIRFMIVVGIVLAVVQTVRLLRSVAFSEGWLTGYYDAQTGVRTIREPHAKPRFVEVLAHCEESGVEL